MNGFSGPKSFRDSRETGPETWARCGEETESLLIVQIHLLFW